MTCQTRDLQKITILGIGNILYADEGIGVHVLAELERVLANYDHVEIIEGATDGMRLLGPVEDTDQLIIIDAINAGKNGGTLIKIGDEEIPKYFGVKMSIHQIGFQEVLLASKLRDQLPSKMVMIGIQPESLELHVGLSKTVENSVPHLVQAVVDQVQRWRGDFSESA